MKDRLRGALLVCLILAAGAVLGVLLLVAVYGIPVSKIADNYAVSLESIESREGWHRYIAGYDISTLDNNTEFLMLKAAATPMPSTGETYTQKVLRCYTYNDEWNHGMVFAQGEYNGESFTCDSYERYWHGYLVLLKPLLVLFTYQDLVYLNIVLQSAMLFFLLKTLRKQGMEYMQIPFLIFWAASMQLVVMLSLDYSVCFYIYMLSVILLLQFPRLRGRYGLFFLGVGMMTSYMDLLTWPLVTLAVPLIVLLQCEGGTLKRTEASKSFKSLESLESFQGIKKIVGASLAWGTGYAVQWASKWLAATLILRDNVIKDAAASLLFRSALGEETLTWRRVIVKNISVFYNMPCLLLGGILLLLIGTLLYRYRGKIKWGGMASCLVVGIFPFLWYLATRNHAYEHYWMTWRNLAVTVFAVCAGLSKCIFSERDNPWHDSRPQSGFRN